MSTYQPRGRVKVLIEAMEDDPSRVWTVPDVARLLKVGENEVMAYVLYALKAEALFRGKREGKVIFRLTAFSQAEAIALKRVARKPKQTAGWTPDDDPRIPRVEPGWRPPVMVPPRAGSSR